MKITRAAVTELAFATLFLLLGLFVLYDAFTLEEPGTYSVVSPKTFAYIIGGFTTLVAIWMIFEILKGKRGVAEGTEKGDPFLPPDIRTMSIVLGVMVLHVILLERIGYIAAASIVFYGITFAFGSRKYVKDVLISFTFAVVVYIVFAKGLRIFLPEGIFEDVLRLSRPAA